jgi:hypothetical protein
MSLLKASIQWITCLKKNVFCAYFVCFEKRNHFVEDFFSIRDLFLRENSIVNAVVRMFHFTWIFLCKFHPRTHLVALLITIGPQQKQILVQQPFLVEAYLSGFLDIFASFKRLRLVCHNLSGIRTRDLWVSSRQCYQLNHWGRFGVQEQENSDAQVGRVNTFHILQTIRKRPSNFRFCMEGPLRFIEFKILST